ncbi:MAG: CPBP family intramembrane metalloprotease [Synechococcaceae cyanobacterium SM2_3_1]|nr:CPBP family intramembrane metalloprotease [Synechococcaceae cyanobacterium SM2_3_1]
MVLSNTRNSAALALILVVAPASLGIAARFYLPEIAGQFCFVLTRIWILALPIIWLVWVDQGKFNFTFPRQQDLVLGAALGLIMFSLIIGGYELIGRQLIDPYTVQESAAQIGLGNLQIFVAFGVYFTLINSLIEEYIWRWFVSQQCEILLSGWGAVGLAALGFTMHHIVALHAYFQNPLVVIVGSLGVFLAGVLWSWWFLRFRSLWSCYVSHALADLAIALVGWRILFS